MEELSTAAKQVGLELISMSNGVAAGMQSWNDFLTANPGIVPAGVNAGFINKPSVPSSLEMVVDVQAPSGEPPILRTGAIKPKSGNDQSQAFNNIQLTFTPDPQQAAQLVAQGGSVTREHIRDLLSNPSTKLASITVSNEPGAGSTQQPTGEQLYDFAVEELSQRPENVPKVTQALQSALETLKQAVTEQPQPQPGQAAQAQPPAGQVAQPGQTGQITVSH